MTFISTLTSAQVNADFQLNANSQVRSNQAEVQQEAQKEVKVHFLPLRRGDFSIKRPLTPPFKVERNHS